MQVGMVEKLRDLVQERLALDLSRRDLLWLAELANDQAKAAGLPDGEALIELLRGETTDGPTWAAMVDRLTIAESYFLRDEGQMNLLRTELLPTLMRQARGRRLRIQSAGCSTGEELYSLAILLDGLGNPPADLLGTDVNPAVLEQARRGVYRERSLRNLTAAQRSFYLQPVDRGYRVVDRLKARTRFALQNLAQEETAPQRGLDLIVCRNVLIYFEREALPGILDRFYRSLRPGGFLLTGHGELLSLETPFETVVYPNSLVYRRADLPGGGGGGLSQTQSLAPVTPGLDEPRWQKFLAQTPPEPDSTVSPNLLVQAREARREGRNEEARDLLRRALYLDPDCAGVYLEMGLLIVDEDPRRASRYRSTALALLAKRPASSEERLALRELEQELP